MKYAALKSKYRVPIGTTTSHNDNTHNMYHVVVSFRLCLHHRVRIYTVYTVFFAYLLLVTHDYGDEHVVRELEIWFGGGRTKNVRYGLQKVRGSTVGIIQYL